MSPPDLDRMNALFLDLDGTLIEIAPTPEGVMVPPSLPALLGDLETALGGALAIVTGRSIETVDRLLAPYSGSAAGEHGVVLRFRDGTVETMPNGGGVPQKWRDALMAAVDRWPGVIVETKAHGMTVHYRLVPERGDDVRRLVRALVPPDHPWFRLIPGREVIEISPRAASKGQAVERLMTRAPFLGRRPIFIGDDYTDEAGIEAARHLGGEGLRVAEAFGGDPAEVRAWLTRGVEALGGRAASRRASVGILP